MPVAPQFLRPSDYRKCTYFVYRRETGAVVHTHHIVVLPGAQPPTDDEIEAQVLHMGSRVAGTPESKLAALTVRTQDLHPNTQYRVEPTTGKLIGTKIKSVYDSNSSKGLTKKGRRRL